MRPSAGLVVLLAACGEATGPGTTAILVELGEVPVGGRVEQLIATGAWSDGLMLSGLRRREDERLLAVGWAPTAIGGSRSRSRSDAIGRR